MPLSYLIQHYNNTFNIYYAVLSTTNNLYSLSSLIIIHSLEINIYLIISRLKKAGGLINKARRKGLAHTVFIPLRTSPYSLVLSSDCFCLRLAIYQSYNTNMASKPLSQLNCDFAGMIIGWSCTKLVNRLLIRNSRWPP